MGKTNKSFKVKDHLMIITTMMMTMRMIMMMMKMMMMMSPSVPPVWEAADTNQYNHQTSTTLELGYLKHPQKSFNILLKYAKKKSGIFNQKHKQIWSPSLNYTWTVKPQTRSIMFAKSWSNSEDFFFQLIEIRNKNLKNLQPTAETNTINLSWTATL